MIHRIIDFSVKNRFLVLLLVGAAAVAGAWSLQRVPLDAIPDLSDTQVIIYSRWDRSPDVVEAQITYPIVTAMLGAPKVRAVRGFSDFGYSFIYVIFEDGTDIYWARTRTLEYLSGVLGRLPQDAKTELGPDASGLGWIYQYALSDTSGQRSLADLRSYQDWTLRYYLKSVPGVAEVASIGGFGRQYQVNVDPNKLRNYGLSIQRVVEAVRGGNIEAGGRLIEFGGTEYMVRGRGYAQSVADFESIVVSASENRYADPHPRHRPGDLTSNVPHMPQRCQCRPSPLVQLSGLPGTAGSPDADTHARASPQASEQRHRDLNRLTVDGVQRTKVSGHMYEVVRSVRHQPRQPTRGRPEDEQRVHPRRQSPP